MTYDEWANDPREPMASDPINLLAIVERLSEVFGDDGWRERLKACIAELMRRGKRPILRDAATGNSEWTDILYEPGSGHAEMFDSAAECVASFLPAFGSGWAEQLWFGTQLPKTIE